MLKRAGVAESPAVCTLSPTGTVTVPPPALAGSATVTLVVVCWPLGRKNGLVSTAR
jgi:hypothetical protein